MFVTQLESALDQTRFEPGRVHTVHQGRPGSKRVWSRALSSWVTNIGVPSYPMTNVINGPSSTVLEDKTPPAQARRGGLSTFHSYNSASRLVFLPSLAATGKRWS